MQDFFFKMPRCDTRHDIEVLCGENHDIDIRQLEIYNSEWKLYFDVGITLRGLGVGIISKGPRGLGA